MGFIPANYAVYPRMKSNKIGQHLAKLGLPQKQKYHLYGPQGTFKERSQVK